MKEGFTDYDYRVRVRIGDDSGVVDVLVTSLEINATATPTLPQSFTSPDLDKALAVRIGVAIVGDARREHYGEEEPGPVEVRRVMWECDYDSVSAVDAARKAWADMQRPGSIANTFTVEECTAEGVTTTVTVDLNEIAAEETKDADED